MFDLTDKTVLITGGCGLLGVKHAEAILEFGGEVILTDVIPDTDGVTKLKEKYKKNISSVYMDVTDKSSIQHVVDMCDKIDVLINNAVLDPKVEDGLEWKNRFEHLDLKVKNEPEFLLPPVQNQLIRQHPEKYFPPLV